jgi:hypothetical protein
MGIIKDLKLFLSCFFWWMIVLYLCLTMKNMLTIKIYQWNSLPVFILVVHRHEFYRQANGRQYLIRKTLVDDLWSVVNNFIDGFTIGKNASKKVYPLHSVSISIDKYNNISPTKKPYIISSVIGFYPSIFPSMNSICNRQTDHL